MRQGRKWTGDEASSPERPAQGRNSTQGAGKELRDSTLTTEPNMRIPVECLQVRTLSEPLNLVTDVVSAVYTCSFIRDIANKLVHNPSPAPVSLQCSQTIYMIPPSASFVLSEISEATAPAFSMAALTICTEPSATTGPGQF